MIKQRYTKDRRKKRFGRRELLYIKIINFLTVTPERVLWLLAVSIIALIYMLANLVNIWIKMIVVN